MHLQKSVQLLGCISFSLLSSQSLTMGVFSDDFATVDVREELCYHSRPKKTNSEELSQNTYSEIIVREKEYEPRCFIRVRMLIVWRRRRDYLRAVPLMASSAGKVSVPFLLRTSPPSRANSCLIHDFERLVSCASAKKGAPKCSLALAQKTRFELVLPVKVLLP